MKYQCSIDIELPIDEVVAKYDNEENLYKWMEGLQAIEPISGTPGEPGAKSNIVFQMGKRRMEMVETVIKRNPPEAITMTYDAKGVHNIVTTSFEKVSDNVTKCINDQEFQMKGFMKLMTWLMPGAFKKQSMKYLKAFKDFAEKGINVNES